MTPSPRAYGADRNYPASMVRATAGGGTIADDTSGALGAKAISLAACFDLVTPRQRLHAS